MMMLIYIVKLAVYTSESIHRLFRTHRLRFCATALMKYEYYTTFAIKYLKIFVHKICLVIARYTVLLAFCWTYSCPALTLSIIFYLPTHVVPNAVKVLS